MFIAAKLLAFLTQPLAWVALLMLAAVLYVGQRPRWSRRLGWTAITLLLLIGWEPLPDALLRRLETHYPALPGNADLKAYAGIVVLGGALESAYVWTHHGQSALNEAAERMTEVLPLLRRQSGLRVLFTGGEGELFGNGLSEAARAGQFFASQGIPPRQLLYESASRTTFENALLGKTVPGVNPGQPWLLMTSAWHMPRAIATFSKTGWNVTPCPVDFRTGQQTPWTQYSMDKGARKWKLALHEWLGLLAYRISGKA
ncbi:YdcF family protein [Rhodoferax sp.]|uniref:YdcF family protein n=1 Tax=Rhodoferax sp. TaxID=50421 RepID=UPI0025F41559|nr:YdcF family protein [Rhodoferax sp.]MCM2297049.1 YdcF family protein [Rhodoferax sp.]